MLKRDERMLGVVLKKKIKSRFKAEADEKDMSMCALARQILSQWLKNRKG